MCVASKDALDGCGGVEACCYAAAESFNACDSVGRGARDDDVDGGGEEFRVLYRKKHVRMCNGPCMK